MHVLGIESSCDDTACAIVDDGRYLLAAERLSSASLQRQFGGVVPEVAAREHALAILPAVDGALKKAGLGRPDVDVVAVTRGPGLLGPLLVGVTFARALGAALGIPVVGVHHLEAHLYANALTAPIQFPALALIVSGGHTSLVYWRKHGDLELIGQTRDDAAGEALDKGARTMGLPYPGGPEIEKMAALVAKPPPWKLPIARGMGLDFSFSGLKTATAERWQSGSVDAATLSFALQEAVISTLIDHLELALTQYPVSHVYLAGGVTANRVLTQRAEAWGARQGVQVHCPPVELCTDNGAMVAAAGYFHWERGECLNEYAGPMTPWSLKDLKRESLTQG